MLPRPVKKTLIVVKMRYRKKLPKDSYVAFALDVKDDARYQSVTDKISTKAERDHHVDTHDIAKILSVYHETVLGQFRKTD